MNAPCGRREALGVLVGGCAALAGCLDAPTDGGQSTLTDGGWDWPVRAGSNANTWRTDGPGPPVEWLSVRDTWRVGGSPTAVAAGDVAVLAGDRLLALDREFSERWQYAPENHPGWQNCALGDGRMFGLRRDGVLCAFDAGTGERQWRHDWRRPFGSLFPTDDALLAFGRAQEVPSSDGSDDVRATAAALDPATGSVEWSRSLEGCYSAALEDHLYVTAPDRLLALDPADGSTVWTNSGEFSATWLPAVSGGVLVTVGFGPFDTGTTAVDTTDGTELWSAAATEYQNPLVTDDAVLLRDGSTLLSYALESGESTTLQRDLPDGLLARTANATVVVGTTVSGSRDPRGQWWEGPTFSDRYDREPNARFAVLDDGLLVPIRNGTVAFVSTDRTVDRFVGAEPSPTGAPVVAVTHADGSRPTPDRLAVPTGTDVRFGWDVSGGTLLVTDQPAGAEWEPGTDTNARGTVTEHRFVVPGRYEYEVRANDASGRGVLYVNRFAVVPEVAVGAGGDESSPSMRPGLLHVPQGTTITFEWAGSEHTLTPMSTPSRVDWDGVLESQDEGHVHEHTFEEPGRYELVCELHRTLSESVTIVVHSEGDSARLGGTRFGAASGRRAIGSRSDRTI